MRPSNEEKITMAIQMRDHKALQEIADDQALSYMMMIAGRAQLGNFVRDLCQVSSLVYLKRIKDSKLYRRMKDMNWDKFCERVIGVSRRKIDEDLQNLEQFGADHLQSMKQVGLGRNDLRAMRALPEGMMRFDSDGFVEIEGEKFKLEPENSDEIKLAIDALQERARLRIEEAEATVSESHEDLRSARQLLGEKDIKIRELTDKLEGPKFAGPKEMVRHVEMIYASFMGALAQLESFPLGEAADHYKILTHLRSYLEHVLCDLANYCYEMDQHYTGIRPDPEIVNEFREEIMQLAEKADEMRARNRDVRKKQNGKSESN